MRPRPSETRGLQSFAVRSMGFCLSSCAHWPHLCCQQICAHLPFACCPLLPVCWSVCSVLHAPCAFSSPTPCSAYYTPLTCPALYSLTALGLFLPAPAVAITFWAFATLGTSTALKITCLFGKSAYCCLVHSSCAAPDL